MNRAKTKLYASVLSLAVVGFVIDRFVIGEPLEAGASLPESARAAEAGSVNPLALAARAPIPEPFPANLKRLDRVDAVRDPFLLPVELARIREQRLLGNQGSPAGASGRKRGEPLTVAQFTRAHSLTGVSVVSKSAMAIVDGRIVEIGQEVDHSRLLTIEGNKAYFKCIDGIAVLAVERRD